jgi:hypothetical protein
MASIPQQIQQLQNKISTYLGSSTSLPSLSTAAGNDLFEVYVFTLVIQAAEAEGAQVSFRDVHGNTVTSLVLRTSPGHLASTSKPYTHALIEFDGKPPLEAHVGIYVEGRSGRFHECDVAVVTHLEAETCRQASAKLGRQVPPRKGSSRLILAAECKFYDTPLGLALARGQVGLQAELTRGSPSIFATNYTPAPIDVVFKEHNISWVGDVVPHAAHNVDRLKHKFIDAFHKYRT